MTVRELYWGPRQLTAAKWVMRTIGSQVVPVSQVEVSFPQLPIGGQVGLGELHSAYQALIDLEVLEVDEKGVSLSLTDAVVDSLEELTESDLLGLLLEKTNPVWLRLATTNGRELKPEYLPAEVERHLELLFPNALEREQFLLERGRVFSAEEERRIGELGEVFLVGELRGQLLAGGSPELADLVEKVSDLSDELGYDITAPRLDSSIRRIEAKTTASRSTSFTFFLTRNEFEVSQWDSDWFLVAVQIKADQPHLVGWTDGASLKGLTPVDPDKAGLWVTTKVKVGHDFFHPGLPPIDPLR